MPPTSTSEANATKMLSDALSRFRNLIKPSKCTVKRSFMKKLLLQWKGRFYSLPPPSAYSQRGRGGAACPRWCCPVLLQCVDHVTLLPPEWCSWCWVKSSLRGGLCVLLLSFDTGTKEGEGCILSAHMHRTCTAGLCLVVLSYLLYLLS